MNTLAARYDPAADDHQADAGDLSRVSIRGGHLSGARSRPVPDSGLSCAPPLADRMSLKTFFMTLLGELLYRFRRKVVGGQEDMIVDVAMELAKRS